MEKIEIKYQVINDLYNIENSDCENEKVIKLSGDLYFDDVVNNLIESEGINIMCPIIENLCEKTWGKIISADLIRYMDETCKFDFKIPHYSISDMQYLFHFFDEKLVIINSSGGFGGVVGEMKGISFVIHSNEGDRHLYEPHIHCEYGGEEFRFRIDNLTVMGNDKVFKNRKKTRLAKRWVAEHKDELLDYYNNFAVNSKTIEYAASI